MFITDENRAVAARKNAIAWHRSAGAKSINEITPHAMAWSDLCAMEKSATKACRAMLDRVDSAEDSGDVEAAVDGFTDLLGALATEKDTRDSEGSKEPRSQSATAKMLAKRPPLDAASVGCGERSAHVEAFTGFLRAPQSRYAQSQLDQFETRTASGLTGAAGGHVVPEVIAGPIASRARDANPFRNLVRVVRVASGDVKFPLSNADASSGWVGETDTRTATTEPTLAAKIPTFGTNYAYVQMTEELANDAVIDVADWFQREVGMALGEAEMAAIVSGDGTNKPKGLLNVAPEAAADGSRTADAFKFLPAVATTAVTGDELIGLIYDLKARYRQNGTWLMNSATAGAIRKLKSTDGAYLWGEALIAGQPPILCGYPVAICEAMPDLTAGQHPVAFGDLDAAYILAETGSGMAVQSADQSITTPGLNKLYVRTRIGGCVYDENALRFLKMAAT